MAFEKFSQYGRRNSSFISITTSNSFGFGGDFLKKNQLTKKDYVELFFDKEALKIGFKFKQNKEPGDDAFKLIGNKGSDSKNVVARSFFTTKLEGLDLNSFIHKYKPETEDDGEFGRLYVIQLKKKDIQD